MKISALVDEALQPVHGFEDEDQLRLRDAETQPDLQAHHLHEVLAVGAVVDDHPLAQLAAGESSLMPKVLNTA